MRESTKHRYVWLFLLAIAVPSITLAWIGARLIGQEQELEQRRRFDEQRRVVSEVRGVLLRRLEGFKLQEVDSLISREFAPSAEQLNPAIVLSGLVDNERLILPWESASRLPEMPPDTDNPPFDELMARGSAAEFSEGDDAAAAVLYGEALAVAQDTGQETRARFLLARTLGKAGRDQASRDEYQTLLRTDTRTADESGVPFALYAVRQLLRADVADTGMAELIEAELERGLLVAPSELYLLRVLAASLADVATDAALRSRASRLVGVIELRNVLAEQALVLQREFSRLGLMPPSTGDGQSAEPSWLSWGDSWLVAVSPLSGAIQGVLVAVRGDEVLEAVEREVVTNGAGESFEIVNASDGASQSLLPNFPGLSVRFASQGSATGPASLRRAFLLVALVLVLSVTLMGGYLLWRDVRREVNVAELRSEFISAVSHELKTPLTSIRMFAETLQMHGTESIHERTEYLDTIVSESQRLTRLLDNVLEFSKIERGAKQYAPRRSSLADIVRASARTMRYPYEREGFNLRVDIAEGIPEIDVDRDAIEQAILNLLTNAMKYSDAGSDIHLALRMENGYALIEVSDHGVGIAAHEQERIFERFYRVPDSDGDTAGGTGLGLTLVQHIAVAHGGHVTVESEPQRGSTFTLHLPLEAHPLEARPSEARPLEARPLEAHPLEEHRA